ncbi:hypothetical protein MMH89_02460 [Candidatus Comchoanobacter bicostacola]|uniref:Uncharacterized protein n=1 Tax=Candidatus Comchoanobacter bicostacola TaxID=2919598 RepID=A0ABY5DI34_9GAMM|nr:hypothetical protein [Candidatus Comchoanobacter bicostacola]UTC24089.1 hypothetical protein MMH89_02460 [Candidatus Comchoanobacter bicostacola]
MNKQSINFLWLQDKINKDQKYLMHAYAFEEASEGIAQWCDNHCENSDINLYYDSEISTSVQIANTQGAFPSVNFIDIRDIEIVSNNPDLFSNDQGEDGLAQIPIYWKIDILKLIILLHQIETKDMQAAIFSDLPCPRKKNCNALEKGRFFTYEVCKTLNKYGLLANGMENQNFQMIKNPYMQLALKYYINGHMRSLYYAITMPVGKLFGMGVKPEGWVITRKCWSKTQLNYKLSDYVKELNGDCFAGSLRDIYRIYVSFKKGASINMSGVMYTAQEFAERYTPFNLKRAGFLNDNKKIVHQDSHGNLIVHDVQSIDWGYNPTESIDWSYNIRGRRDVNLKREVYGFIFLPPTRSEWLITTANSHPFKGVLPDTCQDLKLYSTHYTERQTRFILSVLFYIVCMNVKLTFSFLIFPYKVYSFFRFPYKYVFRQPLRAHDINAENISLMLLEQASIATNVSSQKTRSPAVKPSSSHKIEL